MDWRDELLCILKPCGILIFTIWAHPTKTRNYHPPRFDDYDKLLWEYEDGQFCYSNKLYKGSKAYGEAIIPLSYIKENWARYFELIDFTDSITNSSNQNYVVLRKKFPEIFDQREHPP